METKSQDANHGVGFDASQDTQEHLEPEQEMFLSRYRTILKWILLLEVIYERIFCLFYLGIQDNSYLLAFKSIALLI